MSVGVKLFWPSPPPCSCVGAPCPTATHLDHKIRESGEMSHNTTIKRAILIGKSVVVQDSFALAAASSVLRALQVYYLSYYSSLAGWELERAEVQKFYGVWRLNLLLTHNVPRETHRYFLPMLAPRVVSAKG